MVAKRTKSCHEVDIVLNFQIYLYISLYIYIHYGIISDILRFCGNCLYVQYMYTAPDGILEKKGFAPTDFFGLTKT